MLNANLQSAGNNIILVNHLTALGLQHHPDFPTIIRPWFLVSKGVDPNAKNSYWEHALIILCIRSLFIDCGSNVFVKNRDGLNARALDILRNKSYAESWDVVTFLKSQYT